MCVSLVPRQVFPPDNNHTDLSLTFIDWAPPPADGSMGVWRGVDFVFTDYPILTRYPVVSTVLTGSGANLTAHLTVNIELTNIGDSDFTGLVEISLFPPQYAFGATVTVHPGQSYILGFSYKDYPELSIKNPSLWWPKQMGPQTMHTMLVQFRTEHGPGEALVF